MSYSAKLIIAALKKTKGMIYLAAEEIGCEPKTIYNHIDKNPTVKAAHQAENEKMLDISELKLYEGVVARESWAVKYHLSTKGKNRGYVEKSIVSGDPDSPIRIIVERASYIDYVEQQQVTNGKGITHTPAV